MSATELTPRAMARRDETMKRLRTRGWTLEAIAEKYGLTKQRVHQIVGRGLRPRNGLPRQRRRDG